MRDPDPIRGGGELVQNWLRYQGHDAQADKIAALLAELDRLREALRQVSRGVDASSVLADVARIALAREAEAHRTKEPSECAPDGEAEA